MLEFRSRTGARHLAMTGPRDSHSGTFGSRSRALVAGAALLIALGGGAFWQLRNTSANPGKAGATGDQGGAMGIPALPPPDLIRPLTPEQAVAANAERPLDSAAIDPAAPFRATADQVSRMRAIDCLTQAIYYEAASEGVDGGRAVAQVVLNRVRHPGYPNSVCGTVYQGSERSTGCQFTFTCDGSLARIPGGYLWNRSRRLAAEALAGLVFTPVGTATHYHADYVLPYWADSLDKIAVIGRHIFYRFRGASGSRAAFRQPYGAVESIPDPVPTLPDILDGGSMENAVVADTSTDGVAPIPRVEEDRIEALAIPPKVESGINQPLDADLSRGELISGDAVTTAPKRSREASDNCASAGPGRVKAIEAQDLRVGGAGKPGC